MSTQSWIDAALMTLTDNQIVLAKEIINMDAELKKAFTPLQWQQVTQHILYDTKQTVLLYLKRIANKGWPELADIPIEVHYTQFTRKIDIELDLSKLPEHLAQSFLSSYLWIECVKDKGE